MNPFSTIWRILTACRHQRITWPRGKDYSDTYVCCLDCGRRVPYPFPPMVSRFAPGEKNSGDKIVRRGTVNGEIISGEYPTTGGIK